MYIAVPNPNASFHVAPPSLNYRTVEGHIVSFAFFVSISNEKVGGHKVHTHSSPQVAVMHQGWLPLDHRKKNNNKQQHLSIERVRKISRWKIILIVDHMMSSFAHHHGSVEESKIGEEVGESRRRG